MNSLVFAFFCNLPSCVSNHFWVQITNINLTLAAEPNVLAKDFDRKCVGASGGLHHGCDVEFPRQLSPASSSTLRYLLLWVFVVVPPGHATPPRLTSLRRFDSQLFGTEVGKPPLITTRFTVPARPRTHPGSAQFQSSQDGIP